MIFSSSPLRMRDVEQRELAQRARLADDELVDRIRAAVRRAEHHEACAGWLAISRQTSGWRAIIVRTISPPIEWATIRTG